MSQSCIIIPARFNSKRLYGKPLIKVDGEYLILKTINKIKKIFDEKNIYVCTDNKLVKEVVRKNSNVNTIFSNRKCINGTERCSYAIEKINTKYKFFIIVSCDMPFLNAKIVKFLENKMKKEKKNIDGLTIHTKIKNEKIAKNKNIAKVVLSKNNRILYLSRKLIPDNNFSKNKTIFFSHHGLVMLKKKVLKNYKKLKNTKLQLAEDNEWLKLIENDFILKSYLYSKIQPEINTKKDLKEFFPLNFKLINKKSV